MTTLLRLNKHRTNRTGLYIYERNIISLPRCSCQSRAMALFFIHVLFPPFEESCWTTQKKLWRVDEELGRCSCSFPASVPRFLTPPLELVASSNAAPRHPQNPPKSLGRRVSAALNKPLKATCSGDHLVAQRMHWTAVPHGCRQASDWELVSAQFVSQRISSYPTAFLDPNPELCFFYRQPVNTG